MSCINAEVKILNTIPILSIERIGELFATTTLVSKAIVVKAFDATIHPEVRCNIVCVVR